MQHNATIGQRHEAALSLNKFCACLTWSIMISGVKDWAEKQLINFSQTVLSVVLEMASHIETMISRPVSSFIVLSKQNNFFKQ